MSDPENSRSSLLDQIRKTGGLSGAKLKSAKDRKLVAKKRREEAAESVDVAAASGSGGGDLMSDLAAMLSMRRKGISGSGKGAPRGENAVPSTGGGSAMDRISAMIPPPPKTERSDTVNADDWD